LRIARRDEAHHGRARHAQEDRRHRLIPLDIASVEQSRAYIKAEGEKWGSLVRKLGLEASQ
jgi:hypothetical protein